jgi:transcriptional regulator with XRE-family HTH domain
MEKEKYVIQLEAFGNRMREIRKKKNLTLLDLEASTGIANGALSKIENGLKNMEFITISKIAEGLNVELYELFVPANFSFKAI